MKRTISSVLIIILACLLTGCGIPNREGFISGIKSYMRFADIGTSHSANYDETSDVLTISCTFADAADANLEEEAERINSGIAKISDEYNFDKFTSRIEFYDANGKLLDAYNGTESENLAREECMRERINKYIGAFDVPVDDPMAGKWVKDESSSFSIIWPDEFTYGDLGWIFVTDGKFTFDDGKTLYDCHMSPDGKKLIVENGSLGSVIYKKQVP